MKSPAEKQNSNLMREMFGAIAPRYDFVTRVLSYGMDRGWKRMGVTNAAVREDAVVLDLASGTGDFCHLVRERLPRAKLIAVDLSQRMVRQAQRRGFGNVVCGDATSLPFPEGSFDCVFIGYGLRNFPDLNKALQEIQRVMRPGGRMVSLDFFLPANRMFRQLYLAFLYLQGAFWGFLLHGHPRLYTYIPDSLSSFVSMQGLTSLLESMGFAPVKARAYIFGDIGLHWAVKE